MFSALSHPLFWLALGLVAAGLLGIAWRHKLRWRPAWPLRFLFSGLVLAAVFLPQTRSTGETPPDRQVLIIDQSDSIAPEDRGLALARARQWLQEGENRLVILAGSEAVAASGDAWPDVGGNATDLAGAMALAAEFMGETPGRVILAADGRASNPLAFEQQIDFVNSEIEIIPLKSLNFPSDVFVGPILLPSAMWEDSPFNAVLPIYLQQDADVKVQLFQNDTLVFEDTLSLKAGTNLQTFQLATSRQEIMTLAASVSAENDARPDNNNAYASLRVFPAPRALLLTQDAGTAGQFAAALAATGLDADLMNPADLPASLAELEPYQVTLLHNFLANSLNEAQMRTLKDYVQQLGRGLIFLGGRNAFTLGGYKNTILEPVLPVRLEPPPREQSSPLTFVLVFDRSASMAPQRVPSSLRPITLAREAAIRAAENLGPEDFLGILTYNTNPSWTIPVGPVGEGLALQRTKDAISQVNASGGTSIFKALNTAVSGLLETPTSETRHVLLLSDGQSSDGTLEEFVALAEFANQQGITISTIALGVEADQELMALIAQAGKGRYYPVLQATDLPKILIDESRAARGENVHEGMTFPIQGEPNHPILSGFRLQSMPALDGYNALESKSDQGAEDVLLSADFEDPLLAVWQFGLGRVAAWTGDIGEEWAADWAAWENWGLFWSQIIRYTLPDPAFGPGQVELALGHNTVTISAQILSATGVPRNGVPVSLSLAGADGQVRSYPMPQVAPGLYELALPRPGEGVYRGVVTYQDEDGFPVELAAPLVVNYPAEWRPAPEGETGLARLGRVITWDDLLPQQEADSPPETSPNDSLQRLILALLILWPVEIAIRRRWMPWR